MGEVYTPERVSNGEIPDANGMDQVKAAGLLMNHIRSFPTTSTHARLIIPGSTATGEANRRSDVDYLLVDDSAGLPPNRRGIQSGFIRNTLQHIADNYHVRLEGQHLTGRDVAAIGHTVYDAFWLSHALEVQDTLPDWSHRRPLEDLRTFAIDLERPDDPQKITLSTAIALRYMAVKEATFSEAGEFDSGSTRDLLRFQRALEAPKALARKMLAVAALEGFELESADVTSRKSMKEHMDQILERIDSSGKLRGYNDRLAELDAEYDLVLDEAATKGEVAGYERWLRENYLFACAIALRLSEAYRWHIEGLTYEHPEIDFWKYGIDINAELDAEFALNHSLAEPFVADQETSAAGGQFSESYLYSLAPDEVDAVIQTIEITRSKSS
jgi:hypothetical protein